MPLQRLGWGDMWVLQETPDRPLCESSAAWPCSAILDCPPRSRLALFGVFFCGWRGAESNGGSDDPPDVSIPHLAAVKRGTRRGVIVYPGSDRGTRANPPKNNMPAPAAHWRASRSTGLTAEGASESMKQASFR